MRRLLASSLTLAAALCLLLFVVADGLTLVTDTRWIGELGWTVEWANAGLYLGGCLLAGASSFLSNSFLTRTFLAVVGANTPWRRTRITLSVWARNLLLGVIGHAIVVLIAVLITEATAPTDELPWQAFVYALLPIALFVSLGTLVSALVPNIIGSALAVAVAYLLAFNVASGLLKAPIGLGGYETTLVGLDYSDTALLVWSAIAVGATVVLLAGTILVVNSRSAAPAIIAFSIALLAAFVGPSLVSVDPGSRFVISQHAARFHCAGSAPVVCVASGHTRRLADLAASVDRAARPLRSAGVDFTSTRVHESIPARAAAAGTLLNLDPNTMNSETPPATGYASAFSRPTECAAYADHDPKASEGLLNVSDALTEWISERLDPSVDPSPVAKLPDSWAKAAYGALRDCSVPASVLSAIGPSR